MAITGVSCLPSAAHVKGGDVVMVTINRNSIDVINSVTFGGKEATFVQAARAGASSYDVYRLYQVPAGAAPGVVDVAVNGVNLGSFKYLQKITRLHLWSELAGFIGPLSARKVPLLEAAAVPAKTTDPTTNGLLSPIPRGQQIVPGWLSPPFKGNGYTTAAGDRFTLTSPHFSYPLKGVTKITAGKWRLSTAVNALAGYAGGTRSDKACMFVWRPSAPGSNVGALVGKIFDTTLEAAPRAAAYTDDNSWRASVWEVDGAEVAVQDGDLIGIEWWGMRYDALGYGWLDTEFNGEQDPGRVDGALLARTTGFMSWIETVDDREILFSYDGPHITSVSPNPSKTAGGETLTVLGSSMQDGCVVRLGSHDYTRYSNKIVNGSFVAPVTQWGLDAALVDVSAGLARLFVKRHADPASIKTLYAGGKLSQAVDVPMAGIVQITFDVGGAVSPTAALQFWFDGQLIDTITAPATKQYRLNAAAGTRLAEFVATGTTPDVAITLDNVEGLGGTVAQALQNPGMAAPGTEWGGAQSCPGGTLVSFTARPGWARLYERSYLILPDKKTRYWEEGTIWQSVAISQAANAILTFTVDGLQPGDSVWVDPGAGDAQVITANGQQQIGVTYPAAGNYLVRIAIGSATSGNSVDVTAATLDVYTTSVPLIENGTFVDGTGWTVGNVPAGASGPGATIAGGVASLFVRSYPDPASIVWIYDHGEITETVTVDMAGVARFRGVAAGVSPSRPLYIKLGGAVVGTVVAPGPFVVADVPVVKGDVEVAFVVGGTEYDQSITVDDVAMEAPPPWMVEWVNEGELKLTTPPLRAGDNVIRVTNPDGLFAEFTFQAVSDAVVQPGRRRTIAPVNFG